LYHFWFYSKQAKLLLFKRKVEPAKESWSLIGAFIKNDQSVDDGAKQILLETIGLQNIFL